MDPTLDISNSQSDLLERLDDEINTFEFVQQANDLCGDYMTRCELDPKINVKTLPHNFGSNSVFSRLMTLDKRNPDYKKDLEQVKLTFRHKNRSVVTDFKQLESKITAVKYYCKKKILDTIEKLPRGICHRYESLEFPTSVFSIPLIALEVAPIFGKLHFFNYKVMEEEQIIDNLGHLRMIYQLEYEFALQKVRSNEYTSLQIHELTESKFTSALEKVKDLVDKLEKFTKKRKVTAETLRECQTEIRNIQSVFRDELTMSTLYGAININTGEDVRFRTLVDYEESRLVIYIRFANVREKVINWYRKHYCKLLKKLTGSTLPLTPGRKPKSDSPRHNTSKKSRSKVATPEKLQNTSRSRISSRLFPNETETVPSAPPEPEASTSTGHESTTSPSKFQFDPRFKNPDINRTQSDMESVLQDIVSSVVKRIVIPQIPQSMPSTSTNPPDQRADQMFSEQQQLINEWSKAKHENQSKPEVDFSMLDWSSLAGDHTEAEEGDETDSSAAEVEDEAEESSSSSTSSSSEYETEEEDQDESDPPVSSDDEWQTASSGDTLDSFPNTPEEWKTALSRLGSDSSNLSRSKNKADLSHDETKVAGHSIKKRPREQRKFKTIPVEEREVRATSTPYKNQKRKVTFEDSDISQIQPSKKGHRTVSKYKDWAEKSECYSQEGECSNSIKNKIARHADKEKSIRKLSKTLSDLTLDKASKHNVLLLPPPKLSFTPQSAKTPDSGFNTMDYALPLKNPAEFLKERAQAVKFNKISDVKLKKPFKGDKLCSELDSYLEQERKPNKELQKLLQPQYRGFTNYRKSETERFLEDSDSDDDRPSASVNNAQIKPSFKNIKMNAVQLRKPKDIKISEEQLSNLVNTYKQEKRISTLLKNRIAETEKELARLLNEERTPRNQSDLKKLITYLKLHKEAYDRNHKNLESIKKSLNSCKRALDLQSTDTGHFLDDFTLEERRMEKLGEIMANSIKTCLNPPVTLTPIKYSGLSHDWNHFYEYFKLAVHENPSYKGRDPEKLIALQKCVSHLPSCKRIAQMRPTSENYIIALETLNKYFNHTGDNYAFALHRLQFVVKILPDRIHKDDHISMENICHEIDRFYRLILTLKEDRFGHLADAVNQIAKKLPESLITDWCVVKDTINHHYNNNSYIETIRNGEPVTLLVDAKVRDQEIVRKFVSLLEKRVQMISRLARARGIDIRAPNYKPQMNKSKILYNNAAISYNFNDVMPILDKLSLSDFNNPEFTIFNNHAKIASNAASSAKVFKKHKNRSRKNETRRLVTQRNKDFNYKKKLNSQVYNTTNTTHSGNNGSKPTTTAKVNNTTKKRTGGKRRNTYTATADRFKNAGPPKAVRTKPRSVKSKGKSNNKQNKSHIVHGGPSGKNQYAAQKPVQVSHDNAEYLAHMQKNQNFYASNSRSQPRSNVPNKGQRPRYNTNSSKRAPTKRRPGFPKGTRICFFCDSKNDHITAYCKATDKTPQQREAIARKHRLCLNCLFQNHTAQDCKKGPCRVHGCNRRHNDLLHVYTKVQNTTSNQGTVRQAAANNKNSTDNRQTFPKKVKVPKVKASNPK